MYLSKQALSLPLIIVNQPADDVIAKGLLFWDAAFSEQVLSVITLCLAAVTVDLFEFNCIVVEGVWPSNAKFL